MGLHTIRETFEIASNQSIIITKIKAVEEARNRPSRKKRAMINTT
jgi:hypothetical protein